MTVVRITSPDDPSLDVLCRKLSELAAATDRDGAWPEEQLRLCGQAGVFEWFLPVEVGGQDWSDVDVARGYLALSRACLTTCFVLTQRTGACRRIAVSANEDLRARLLADLVTGRTFATVGISHLTTSRRHLERPALAAIPQQGGFRLEGYSPWVTGAIHADSIVMGATLSDGREVLLALPTDAKGVVCQDPIELVGLSGSHTGPVSCNGVFVGDECVVDGPVKHVMATGQGTISGGLQTSTLAIGLAGSAVAFLKDEASRRDNLVEATAGLASELTSLESDLLELAAGEEVCTLGEFRAQANSLVLRATQAALAAAKGTGYVVGHPAGRWCREALFFLVWSCPQSVMAANLCEFAGLSD